MKKVIIFVLILSMTFAIGCGKKAEVKKVDVTVEGAIFSGNAPVSLTVPFSADWLTEGDNTKFNKDLSLFAAILSTDVYFREKDVEKGTQTRVLPTGVDAENYDRTSLLSAFGFTDIEYVESFKTKQYETDSNDSVTVLLGHLAHGDKYECYVAAVRGAYSAGEWVSAFDIGSERDDYVFMTGEHSEWQNKNEMKGVSVAAARAEEIIKEYISEHDDESRENCILITGHSRGGSIAQIVGAHFEDEKSIKSATYAFSAPSTTTDKNALNYETVFNVFNTEDFYTKLFPFGNQEFYRYGKDVCLDKSADSASMSKENYDLYKELFGKIFPSRDALYDSFTLRFSFDDETTATSKLDELSKLIGDKGLALSPYCFVSDARMNSNLKYELDLVYTKASLLFSISRVLSYGSAAADAVKTIFSSEVEFCKLIDVLTSEASGISGGHAVSNVIDIE